MPQLALKIARTIALVLLALSLLWPWLRVPIDLHEEVGGKYAMVFAEPHHDILFKGLIVVVLLVVSCLVYRQRCLGITPKVSPVAIGGWILLLTTAILYPALTMQRCAAVSAHASWLQAQNYSLIEPDGDSFNAQEYFYQAWQPEVDVKEVLPRSFSAMPVPFVYSFSDLHLAKLEELAAWLGLSPAFCEFVRRGWFCGLFGSFLLAVFFTRTKSYMEVPTQGKDGRSCPVWLLALAGALAMYVLCLMPIVMAGRELSWAHSATLRGKFSQALEHLDTAQVWLPIFAYDTSSICQRGWLERKLGVSSPLTKVFSAICEEEEGFSARAAEDYAFLLKTLEPGPARSEAFRGALRLALKDINSGMTDRSADRQHDLSSRN